MIYFFISYFILLIAFIGYSAAGIYHLWRFGYVGDLTRPMIVIYCLASAAIISVSLTLMILELQATG